MNESFPSVSVIIPVYNEEKAMQRRIENMLTVDYPNELIEIIIASDGSTDKTIEIARQYEKENIKILDFKRHRGRAIVQNEAAKIASGDILIFTDANTIFHMNFLKEIVKPYSSSQVGSVVGNLVYNTNMTSISESEGFYWKFEKKLREIESYLGILATGTGACMSVRRNLWRDLSPIDDCDFTTPLDVILQGQRVNYSPEPKAYDKPASSIKGELKTRIRQTSKNLVGTFKRWGIKGWFYHPVVSWGLLSHKILRWFTPFFMICFLISNILLLEEGLFYQIALILQLAFYLMAIIGLTGEIFKKRIPLASIVFSFCLANVGMGMGVIKGIIGKAPAAFKEEE